MSPHRSTAQSNTASYTCRDSINKSTIPQPRTNCLRNSFRSSVAVLWNSLPETLTKDKQNPFVISNHVCTVIIDNITQGTAFM